MAAFTCPRCRMAFSSRPLLRAHEEQLCLGTPAAPRLPTGQPLPAEGAPGAAGRPRDTAGVSRAGDPAGPGRRLLLPPGSSAAVQGPMRAGGAPLGDVLTPRERALLRAAGPAAGRTTAEGAPARPPAPPRGHQQRPAELVEAHERRMAEIRARTQRLEQHREGLCQRLAALRAQAAVDPQPPKQGDVELTQAPLRHGRPAPRHPPASRRAARRRGQVRAVGDGGSELCPHEPRHRLIPGRGRALRLSYLRAGGHDPHILDQLLHLQVEATVLEKGPQGQHRGKRPEPPSTGAQGLDAALLAVELENRRLEDELLAVKVRRERRADAGSRAAQRQAQELAQLQAEVGMLRCHTERMGPRLPPAILPPPVAPPLPAALPAPELLVPLSDFPRTSPGPAWAQAAPQPPATPMCPRASPPLWLWRILHLLRSSQHSTDLPIPRGEMAMGYVPTAWWDMAMPQHPSVPSPGWSRKLGLH
ncbi:coiled-coil domain-containing protein 17 isoform X2 [Lathamus discolor]|uniref:coiled-coil domain-containing protein 17 isoform X2 n=1 Tax=Lathamus discolor TaxID=678569 RepID=UPI0032B719F1